MSENNSKQPSFILEHEVTGKDGKVYATRIGATFARDDGRSEGKLTLSPGDNRIVISTPEQRLERMNQQKEKSAEKDIER